MDEFNDDNLLEMEIPPMPESMVVKEGGERLVISHIQVENFKSYYGKQIIGPFHKVNLTTEFLHFNTITNFSVSPPLLGQMEAGKAMSSTPYSLFSAIALLKFDRRKSAFSFIHRLAETASNRAPSL
jgi:hypothetical protein